MGFGWLKVVGIIIMGLTMLGCSDTAPETTSGPSGEGQGAAQSPLTPQYIAGDAPQRFSDWGMATARDGRFVLGNGVRVYDLATPLFSDYALKLRTIWTPGGAVGFSPDGPFDFPVGSVVTKTFFYPLASGVQNADFSQVAEGPTPDVSAHGFDLSGYRLIETRVLVRRDAGWEAISYLWDDNQQEARLTRIGALKRLTLHDADAAPKDFAYLVPNTNQCVGCHATNASTKEILPIGLRARHLGHGSRYAEGRTQLAEWSEDGLLNGYDTGQSKHANAVWTDETVPLSARARAYLDINCSHCHNPKGPADTSGLDLTPSADGPAYGFCKPPIAAGRGTGGHLFDIVPGAPDQSILVHRLETEDPGAMMPELGRALTHREGVALISDWISAMASPTDGACGA